MCTYIKKISTRRYLALTVSVKIRKSSPKQLGMNKFVRTKCPAVSKFPEI